ncbi:hypothetical protein QQ045_029736 [Rhodiola kirilowii]
MGSKQIKITGSSLPDRMSDLPSNIIESILDRIPIREAVATSVLSKGWRHRWRRIPSLVFDDDFVGYFWNVQKQRGFGEARIKLEYSNVIGKILLLHLGPIHKFVLHIPDLWSSFPLDLSSWMLFISQNKVKELTIEDLDDWIVRLPSYVFQCDELQHLKLHFEEFYLHPPHDFRGFCNLLSLDLSGFLDGDEISNLVSKCPLLERLSLNCMACSHPLVIDAPRLLFLHVYFMLNAFPKLKSVCSLTAISLLFQSPGTLSFCDLFDFFGSVPKVETVTLLTLHPMTVMPMPQDAPTSFHTTLHNHKSLTLLELNISSPQCMYFVLCILKSSPNLQKLNLYLENSPETIEDEAASHLLDMQTREPHTLNSLLTIKIKRLSGSKVEIMFIKMILSCSPVLKTMYLTGTYSSGLGKDILNEAESTLMSELLQCTRSSYRAQVNYSRYPGDSSIFDF